MKVKIEGNNNLIRDIKTNAIVNTNYNAFLEAKQRKFNKKQQLDNINTLNNKVNDLENKINIILELLQNK